MNSEVALFWAQEALKTAALIAAPILIAALIVGLIVSLVQAVTSIQEMTLSFIPKLLAAGLIVFFLTPWILQTLTDFMVNAMTYIPELSR